MNKTQLEMTLSMLEVDRKSLNQERDTYRDLCAELLESLETLHERAGSQSSLTEDLIEKAKQLLGEKNGTAK